MPKKSVGQVNKKEEEELHAKKVAFWGEIVELEKKHGLELIAMLEYKAQGIIPVIGIGTQKATEETK